MTLKTRRILFYSLILIFLVLGTAVVFYAQGWRLDWKNLTPVQVGGIYIRTRPPQAQLFLDGKEIKNKSGLLFPSGTLISNLFPKSYRLTIVADGFQPLERNIVVKPTLVTAAENIVLVPIKGEIITANADDFWQQGGEILNSSQPDLSTLLNRLHLNPQKGTVLPDPGNNGRWIYYSSTTIALINPAREQKESIISLSPTSTEKVSAVIANASWVIWSLTDQNYSRLFVSPHPSRSQKSPLQTIAGKSAKMKFGNKELLGIAQEDGEFYLYRPADNILTHLASDVRDFFFSTEGNKVALLGSRGLEIFSLTHQNRYWRFNLPAAQSIKRIDWYKDGQHLFVYYPQEIRFLDLDDAGLESFIPVAKSEMAEYKAEENTFYYLATNKIMALRFPD